MMINNKLIIAILVYVSVFALCIASTTTAIGNLNDGSKIYPSKFCNNVNYCVNISDFKLNTDLTSKITALYAFTIILIILIVICFIIMFYNSTIYKYLGYAMIILTIITMSIAASVIAKIGDLKINIDASPILILVSSIFLLIFHIAIIFI